MATPLQVELCSLLHENLPAYLDDMAAFQFKKAKEHIPLEVDGFPSWKPISIFLHAWADCECSYNKMIFLYHQEKSNEIFSILLGNLKACSLKCADIFQLHHEHTSISEPDITRRRGNHSNSSGSTHSLEIRRNSNEFSIPNPSRDIPSATCLVYKTFFIECELYIEQRAMLTSLYLSFGKEKSNFYYLFDYNKKLKFIETIQESIYKIKHPLFHELKLFLLNETKSLQLAFQTEIKIAQYNYIESIVLLHQFKTQLEFWAELIDNYVLNMDPTTRDSILSITKFDTIENCLKSPQGMNELNETKLIGFHQKKTQIKNGEINQQSNQSISSSQFSSISHTMELSDDGILLPLYKWSKKLYFSLHGKFSFYFFKWLDRYEKLNSTGFEIKKSIKGYSYIDSIETFFTKNFQKEPENAQIMIVIDTYSLPDHGALFHSNGYLCPAGVHKSNLFSKQINSIRAANKTYFGQVSRYDDNIDNEYAKLWGIGSWPIVFSYPKPELDTLFIQRHWPNLVMLMQELPPWNEEIKNGNKITKITIHHEKKINGSYVYSRIDPSIYLAMVYEKRRQNISEKNITELFSNLLENLQHENILLGTFLG